MRKGHGLPSRPIATERPVRVGLTRSAMIGERQVSALLRRWRAYQRRTGIYPSGHFLTAAQMAQLGITHGRRRRQRVTANLPERRQLRVERFAAAGDGAVIRPPFHCDYRKAPSQSGRGSYYLRGFLRQTIVGEFAAVQPREPTNPHQAMLPCRGGRPG
jgi:hypothetical protein